MKKRIPVLIYDEVKIYHDFILGKDINRISVIVDGHSSANNDIKWLNGVPYLVRLQNIDN